MRTTSGATISRLAPRMSRVVAASAASGSCVEGLLVGPQQVDGGQHDAAGGHHRPPPVGEEGADRIRNSPTNPFSPGRPMVASMATVKTAARIGRRPLQAPQLDDLPRLAALVDPADQDEQQRR